MFADRASRLAGACTLLFGWRPSDFWEATPAELGAILSAMDGGEDARACSADLARLMERFPDG
ncbi:MAG: phage tail assembly chaperone [Sphingomonadaceae bacterium]|nr:phage tail assembly chaperone [Sphingomonadaceae bacterium]